MKKILLFFLLIVMLFAAGCNDDDSDSNESSVILLDKASQEIQKTDPDAMIVWGGGRKADLQPMASPDENDLWNFIAISLPSNAKSTTAGQEAYWWMEYDGDKFTIKECNAPFEILYTDMSDVSMKVAKAWRLAAKTGYSGTFNTWEIFQPLNPSSTDNPIYVFSMTDGMSVLVDTITEAVSSERQTPGVTRDAWDCLTRCRDKHLSCMDRCREDWPGEAWCYENCDEARLICDDGCMW